MKRFFNALFFGKAAVPVFTLLAAISALLLHGFRNTNVFVDTVIFSGFSFALFIAAVLDTALLFCLWSTRLQAPDRTKGMAYRILAVLGGILAIVLAVIAFGFSFGNLFIGGSESLLVGLRLCKAALPMWLGALALAAAALLLPYIHKDRLKRIFSGILCVCLLIAVYAAFFPLTPFRFTALPVVFDTGSAYSVVFATNDIGTAYIEYEISGETVRRYDASGGRKNGDSCIHTICVPYEELANNTYKVGATRVLDELSYGGRSGKTIESESIAFGGTFSDEVKLLTLSDWHMQNRLALDTAQQLGSFDALIMLGDSATGLMQPEEVAAYILDFGATLTGGQKPVLFARGNHETRGKAASNLPAYLGLDSLYYTAQFGQYHFIILDSGEDKADDHPEYGGMTDYEQSRRDMVTWLQSLENPNGEKTIALSHSEEICIEEDLSAAAHEKLDSLGVSLLVSGHWHTTEFKTEHSYPTLIDGGWNANGANSYVASMLTLTPEGVGILSVDNSGQTTVQETVAWR